MFDFNFPDPKNTTKMKGKSPTTIKNQHTVPRLPDATGCYISGLEPDGLYRFWVRAVNEYGAGPLSDLAIEGCLLPSFLRELTFMFGYKRNRAWRCNFFGNVEFSTFPHCSFGDNLFSVVFELFSWFKNRGLGYLFVKLPRRLCPGDRRRAALGPSAQVDLRQLRELQHELGMVSGRGKWKAGAQL